MVVLQHGVDDRSGDQCASSHGLSIVNPAQITCNYFLYNFHQTSHNKILQTHSGLIVIKFVEAEQMPEIGRKYAFSVLHSVVMIRT